MRSKACPVVDGRPIRIGMRRVEKGRLLVATRAELDIVVPYSHYLRSIGQRFRLGYIGRISMNLSSTRLARRLSRSGFVSKCRLSISGLLFRRVLSD